MHGCISSCVEEEVGQDFKQNFKLLFFNQMPSHSHAMGWSWKLFHMALCLGWYTQLRLNIHRQYTKLIWSPFLHFQWLVQGKWCRAEQCHFGSLIYFTLVLGQTAWVWGKPFHQTFFLLFLHGRLVAGKGILVGGQPNPAMSSCLALESGFLWLQRGSANSWFLGRIWKMTSVSSSKDIEESRSSDHLDPCPATITYW